MTSPDRESARPQLCIHCGYDLGGVDSPRCPECGRRWNRAEPIEVIDHPAPLVAYTALTLVSIGTGFVRALTMSMSASPAVWDQRFTLNAAHAAVCAALAYAVLFGPPEWRRRSLWRWAHGLVICALVWWLTIFW